MAIEPIDLREIDKRTANVYEAIVVASKRARQLNDEYKIEYNALISTIPAEVVDDDVEDVQNPAQLKVSLEFEKRDKPHIQALKELLENKIEYGYKN